MTVPSVSMFFVRHRRTATTTVVAALVAGVAAMATIATPLSAQTGAGDSTALAGLPLRELPVTTAGHQLVFLLTGDGGYAAGDRGIAEAFVGQGIPVVVLNSRSYLSPKKTPDEAAADAERIMMHYMAGWQRDSVVLVGYSRGADMAPFIVTRLPDSTRSHLSLVAMIGLADHASFEFHWSDIVKDVRRSTDLPVEPEVMKIHGVRMLCLYGAHEKGSLCPTLPPAVLTADRHGGKHSLSGDDGAEVAKRILRELETPPAR
jgi:type IV secretory pathway VirJ component